MRFGYNSSSESESEDINEQLPSLPPLQRSRRPLRRSSASASPAPAPPPTPKVNFNPTPITFIPPPPPNLNRNNRRTRRLILPVQGEGDSSDSSTAAQGDSSDDDDDLTRGEDSSDVDSEEEAWPVGPLGSVGVNGWRRGSGAQGKGKARATGRVLQGGGADAFESWDDQQRANSWATANRSFHLSLSRSLRTPSLASPSPSTSSSTSPPAADLTTLLSSLTLAHSLATQELLTSFQSRNTLLWESIESSILAAEEEEGERQRVLEEQRRKGEEAAKRARELREAEERKVREEEEGRRVQREKEEREREEERARVEEEQERGRREVEELEKKKGVTVPPRSGEGNPNYEWERWTEKMNHIKTTILPTVSLNPSYRKSCFTAKRSITPKIGQLTSSSSATLRIITQLDELLSSLRPPSGTQTSDEQEAPYIWTLNHLAKALIKQAETEVTAKLGTAYPLGRVVIGLITRGHEKLGEVLMARLVKKCFWITGYYPPRSESQTPSDHLRTLGHTHPPEPTTLYSTRQSGLLALYSSILSTSPLSPPQVPCPPSSLALVPAHFRPQAGWRLLLLLLRPPLVSLEPTPLLLVTFLQIAAPTMLQIYGRQFSKLLELLLREGLRGGKVKWHEKAGPSRVRLELWLEDWERRGAGVECERVKGGEVDE